MRTNFKQFGEWLVGQTKILVAVVITAIVSSGGALVFASIPDANGLITACRDTLTGAARIIDTASESCGGGETEVSWRRSPVTFVSDLTGADFTSASLQYRDFRNVDLSGAMFGGALVTGADFGGANLSNTLFTPSGHHVNLVGANFAGAEIQGSLTSSNFSGLDLSNMNIMGHFEGSNFTNTDFSGSTISMTTFYNDGEAPTNLTNTDFTDAVLYQVVFTHSSLESAILDNVTWNGVTCPDGTNSDNNENTCEGHLAPLEL